MPDTESAPKATTLPASSLRRTAALIAALTGAVTAQLAGGVLAALVLVVLAVSEGLSKPAELEALAKRPLVLLLASPAVSLSLALVACVTPWAMRVPIRSSLGLGLPKTWLWPLAAAAIPGVATLGDLLSQALTRVAPNFTMGTGLALVELTRGAPLALLIPVLAILPGMAEELFFRGMLQRAFGNSLTSAAVVGVVFALYHLDPPHVAATLPIGVYLGWLGARSGSTLLPMAVHVTNNGLAIAAARSDALHFGFGTDVGVPLWWTAPSLSAAVVAIAIVGWGTRPIRSAPAGEAR